MFWDTFLLTKDGGELTEAVNPLLKKFYEIGGIVIPVVIGVAAILIVIKLILLGMKLAQSGDDPEERSRIIKGMIWWGIGLLIAIAAVTSISIVFKMLSDNMDLPDQIKPANLCMYNDY